MQYSNNPTAVSTTAVAATAAATTAAAATAATADLDLQGGEGRLAGQRQPPPPPKKKSPKPSQQKQQIVEITVGAEGTSGLPGCDRYQIMTRHRRKLLERETSEDPPQGPKK